MVDNIEVLEIFEKFENKCIKALEHYKSELLSTRAGRANSAVLNKITVDYYGTTTPLNQIANISSPEARMLVISLYDVSMIKEVSKAIMASDIGINPSDDGKLIRLVFPQLTQERRLELVKKIKKTAEDTRVVLRNERRDAVDAVKKLKKDNILTEDDLVLCEKDIQKDTDKHIELVDKLLKDKEAEILEV